MEQSLTAADIEMNGADENNPPLPVESGVRIAIAWLSWWLMLSSGAAISAFVLGAIFFYLIGGSELLSAIWAGAEVGNYLWVVTASAAGVPAGAILGVRLWGKLMRRTGWISVERTKRMSSF
jgi:hypothetical protein